jgi:hypothetical protein
MKNASKKGVSLLELMVAMVASSAILGGAGVIYMTALSSFVSAEATGKISSSRAMLDEVLTRVGHQSFPGDIVCLQASAADRFTIVTYARARRLDPAPLRQGVQNYPIMASNPLLLAPERTSGVVFWFRDALNALTPPTRISHIYHLELSQEQYQTCATAGLVPLSTVSGGTYFSGMTAGDLDSFLGLSVATDSAAKQGRRLACNLLATNVSNFEVLKGTNAEAITWEIDFGTTPL